MAVFRRIVGPDLLVADEQAWPAQAHDPFFQPMNEHVVGILGQRRGIILGPAAGARGILIQVRAVHRRLHRRRQQGRIRRAAPVGRDAFTELVCERLCGGLTEYIDDLEAQELAGAIGGRVPEQFHEHAPLGIVGQDQPLTGIIPDGAQLRQRRVRGAFAGSGVAVVKLGCHRLREGRIVRKIDSTDAGLRHGNREAHAREGFLGPIQFAGWLHSSTGNDVVEVGQGVVKTADGDLVGVSRGDAGLALAPGDLDRARHRGKNLPGIGAVVVVRRRGRR